MAGSENYWKYVDDIGWCTSPPEPIVIVLTYLVIPQSSFLALDNCIDTGWWTPRCATCTITCFLITGSAPLHLCQMYNACLVIAGDPQLPCDDWDCNSRCGMCASDCAQLSRDSSEQLPREAIA